MAAPLFLGIDFGTSGCRAVAIDTGERVVATVRHPLPPSRGSDIDHEQSARDWADGLEALFRSLADPLPLESIAAVAIDATSGSVLLTDENHRPLTPALMYNDGRAGEEAAAIASAAGATGEWSGLARLLWLQNAHPDAVRYHCQGSWLNQQLLGPSVAPVCDSNNALKLGYDPLNGRWPDWLGEVGMVPERLPAVVTAGTTIGPIDNAVAAHLGLAPDTRLVAGTTDSTAAIIAAGVAEAGDAVTSLGSTLVVKVVSPSPIVSAEHGVYSQPFGELWLVGGASNSGGAVLRQLFSDSEMAELTPLLDPDNPTGLDYYPLPGRGERFPINDPRLESRLEPLPDDRLRLFQGVLEGIAAIEQRGYRLLERLGAPYPRRVVSVGGGAFNAPWRTIRARLLGVEVTEAGQSEAAFGAARLALRGWLAER